jgi:LuxR family maltose regulon positive regulatory protein
VVALELTPREVEILALLAEKLSNRQIADRLFLSLHTVKNHVHHILSKMEVRHRREAVEKAYGRRWLPEQRVSSALSVESN